MEIENSSERSMALSADIFSLSVVLLGVLIAPIISNKTKIPVIVVEIIFGIVVGTSLLNIITEIEWLNFFSFFGLIYLLFLAGLEIEFEEIRRSIVPVLSIATGSLLLPFALGYFLAMYIRVNPIFLGVILSTTSLGVVLPIAKSLREDDSFFQILLGATVLVDMVSMFLLVIALEIAAGSLSFHYLFSITFFLAMFVLPFLVRRIGLRTRIWHWSLNKTHFQFEVRFCFALMVGLAILIELIGMHAILGAFLAGLVISELTDRGSDLEQKLLGIGYGFFIPFFFILVGVNTNIPAVFGSMSSIVILFTIILVGIFSKVIGVGTIAKLLGFSTRKSISLGFIKSARLSLVLAAIGIGQSMGLIDSSMYSIFVIFALTSVLLTPSIGISLLKKKIEFVKIVVIPEEFWELS